MPRAVLAALLLAALAVPAGSQAGDLAPQWRKGVNVTGYWWQDFSGKPFRTWLTRAKLDAHADWVTFVVTWYQYSSDPGRSDPLKATAIRPAYGNARICRGKDGHDHRTCKTPSLSALRAAVARAKALGFRVALRPQVDVGRDARSAASRQLIDIPAARRQAWFDAYKHMLSQYARIARDTHADSLVIGSDLSGMTNDEEDRSQWRQIILDLRSGTLLGDGRGGYGGELTYASDWNSLVADAADPLSHLFFWDALDAIGIDAYFPLVSSKAGGNPSIADLRSGWGQRVNGLERSPVEIVRGLHDEYAKPVLFTGLGYLSRLGTAAYPEKSDADQARVGGRRAMAPQQRAVKAAFDVWSDIAGAGWFDGIWWWEWPAPGRGGLKDGSHSLQGKPAQIELCHRHAPAARNCRVSPGL